MSNQKCYNARSEDNYLFRFKKSGVKDITTTLGLAELLFQALILVLLV
tara:strand:+ start:454 stop:597 length:144 start_codon:yes stop_codon:yes gene_type:complete